MEDISDLKLTCIFLQRLIERERVMESGGAWERMHIVQVYREGPQLE